ncbi:MAG TPA: zincin-like metallopeptidase domain-containing protein [Methanosarcinales archaeon]|nr:zincin-like metallopeptidase domain-containing protein [Methanosarcinales archaeon]
MSNKVYDRLVSQIIESLEKGNIPWRKPWNSDLFAPCNFETKRRYTGINPLILASRCFTSPYWLTFKACAKLGGKIKKGEHGTAIAYWKFNKVEEKNSKGELKEKTIPFCRYYTVFNLEQTEGIEYSNPEIPDREFTPIEAAEKVVEAWEAKPVIEHMGNRACYSPSKDIVTMPPKESFISDTGYYATLFHELSHSTGHETRLNRDLQNFFGDHEYSVEELIAEISACFLCSDCGIDTDQVITNTTAYCQSWVSKLKDKPQMIISAASKAQKATNMILNQSAEKDDTAVEDKAA